MEQIQLLNVEKEYPLLLLCSLLFFLGSIYPPLFLRNLRIKVRAGFLSRSLQDRRYVAGITLCNCDCLCASPTLASNLKVSIFVKSYGKLTAVIFISSTIKYEQETLYFVWKTHDPSLVLYAWIWAVVYRYRDKQTRSWSCERIQRKIGNTNTENLEDITYYFSFRIEWVESFNSGKSNVWIPSSFPFLLPRKLQLHIYIYIHPSSLITRIWPS